MHVIESDFTVGKMEGRIELLNGFTVCEGIGEMELPFAVRVGGCSGGLHGKIGLAGDRIVVSRKRLEIGDLGVAHVGAQVEGAVAREMAVVESGGDVEFD